MAVPRPLHTQDKAAPHSVPGAPSLAWPERARRDGEALSAIPAWGDSCASIFIQNSQETWMKCNYLSSINLD